MVHDSFDLARWRDEFPLAKIRQEKGDAEGYRISGPRDIAVVEQIRAEVEEDTDFGLPVPTDVCVWNIGEPTCRSVTKLGGLPYWPAEQAWPSNPNGSPMTFVAQFCFADSHELIDQIPADVLLIFAPGKLDVDWTGKVHSELRFEWVPLGDQPLISGAAVPPQPWNIKPMFAALHRTADYPEAILRGVFCQYINSQLLALLQGTKIGGVPSWIGDDSSPSGLFLCSLSSVTARLGGRFPFINLGTTPPIREHDYLMLRDAGSLYIFVRPDGSVEWVLQDYYNDY